MAIVLGEWTTLTDNRYLQDQFIIFMALADGVSRIRTGPLTMHTQTAIHFTSLISGAKFTVTELTDKRSVMEKPFLIEVRCSHVGVVKAVY